MAKTTKDVQDNRTDPTPAQPDDLAPYRTGPNVDAGLEPGAITVDPQTAAGKAAEAAREVNGAKTEVQDRVEVVTEITDHSDGRTDDVRRVALKEEGDPRVNLAEQR